MISDLFKAKENQPLFDKTPISSPFVTVEYQLSTIVEKIKDIDSLNNNELCGEKMLKEAAEVWLSRSVPNNTNIANKYLSKINEKSNKSDLENELRVFRKEKSKSMNVPAYYIFTDEEMNNILNTMPKTVEELKIKKILSDIKIKCHGEEIIKILNEK